jgi:multiple sugar transport system permease protein
MFSFRLSWNEFVDAPTFISRVQLMAASLLGSVPVAPLYSCFMDYFVSGLTTGAIKG